MNELLKRLKQVKDAQTESVTIIQKTSLEIQAAYTAVENALRELEDDIVANNTAISHMMTANQQALAVIRGEKYDTDRRRTLLHRALPRRR